MANFFNLEMAREVVKHPMIRHKHFLFGKLHSVKYTPTQSDVESYSNFYKQNDAQLIRDLIECPENKVSQYLLPLVGTTQEQRSNFRLDLCISRDMNFIAMQLNHVADNVVTHITPIRYFEGETAQEVQEMFD